MDNKTQPLLSVIVPIYNQEKYVAACLESLFSQATEQIEFLLMNDGSTDGSEDICREYLNRFPVRGQLISQENQGLLQTRKNGLDRAAGAYILFVDSDDCLLEGALETLIQTIENDGPDIVMFNATNDLSSRKPLFSYTFSDGQTFAGDDKYELYRLLCCTDRLNNIWAKCIRRSLLDDPEVYRDIEGISNGEDLYQSLVLIDRAQKLLYLDRVFYYYRVSSTSMSRSYNPRHFTSEKKVCARRLEYAEKWSRNKDELVTGAKIWICRILRDVSRKLFVSNLPWPRIQEEMRRLRNDEFYRAHYSLAHCDPNPRDLVLKSPMPLLRVWKAIYGLKGGQK